MENFNKNDLKDGMLVQLRTNDYCIVLNDTLQGNNTVGWINLNDLDNLNCFWDHNLDIIKVYIANGKYADIRTLFCSVIDNYINNEEIKEYLKLIYDREDEKQNNVNWTEIPLYTKVQVRNSNSEKWKNRYFVKYTNLNGADEFLATTNTEDAFIGKHVIYNINKFKYCRLYKENNTTEC